MSTDTAADARRLALVQAILLGGLVAGALDILDAFVLWGFRGVSPIRILQAVASGLLGPDARNGGYAAAAIGLAAHFFIALVAAALYCIASLRFNFLLRRAVFSGLVFGLCVYIVMNYIVVPLSAAQGKPPGGWMIVNGLFAHLVLFGLPIALFARRYLSGVTGRSAAIMGAPREETGRA